MVREASFERGEPGKGLKLSYCSLLCAGKILPHRLVSFYKAGHILTQGPDHMESRADGHIHWDCGSNICWLLCRMESVSGKSWGWGAQPGYCKTMGQRKKHLQVVGIKHSHAKESID